MTNGASSDNQRVFPLPSAYKFSGVTSNRNSVEDMPTSENLSSNASSPRDSASEYFQDK